MAYSGLASASRQHATATASSVQQRLTENNVAALPLRTHMA
jgi:hypothetical protein